MRAIVSTALMLLSVSPVQAANESTKDCVYDKLDASQRAKLGELAMGGAQDAAALSAMGAAQDACKRQFGWSDRQYQAATNYMIGRTGLDTVRQRLIASGVDIGSVERAYQSADRTAYATAVAAPTDQNAYKAFFSAVTGQRLIVGATAESYRPMLRYVMFRLYIDAYGRQIDKP